MQLLTKRGGPRRPALRYYGGKWRLAPWIISHLPPHAKYVEPFGGAASVLLRKPRSELEVYNDRSGIVVNLFRVLRDQPVELAQAVTWTPFARDEYRVAQLPSIDALEKARRLLIRSFMGHGATADPETGNGFRSKDKTNPAATWSNLAPHLLAVADRMRGVTIENAQALDIIERHDAPDTLFYIDPPYVHDVRYVTTRYGHEMSDADHEALAARLSRVKGMVLLSGYPSPLYARLYKSWKSKQRTNRDMRGKVRTEILWFNDAAFRALRAR